MLPPEESELSEHAAWMNEHSLVPLLECGLQATLRNCADISSSGGNPLNFLASWLLRHNPKHSEAGERVLKAFAAMPREELESLEVIEARNAAVTMLQANARGRRQRLADQQEAQLMAQSAVRVQAQHRGVLARREQKQQAAAASRVQAATRGRMARREEEEEEPEPNALLAAMVAGLEEGAALEAADPSSDAEEGQPAAAQSGADAPRPFTAPEPSAPDAAE